MRNLRLAAVVGMVGAVGVAAMWPAAVLGDQSGGSGGMTAAAETGAFAVDPVHSTIVWGVGHLGVARVYGTFSGPTGRYLIDLNNPSSSFAEVSLKAATINSGNGKRDDHLRNPDFFDVEKFPMMSFKSSSFEKTGERTMKLKGDLTLLAVTKPIEATVEFIGEGETRQGYKSGFEARFTIKRSDFGMMTYLEGGAIGDEVSVIVAIEGKRE